MSERLSATLWVHKIPIVFVVAGAVLILVDVVNVLIVQASVLLDPPLGFGFGVLYIVLGLSYEWTIQKQQELDEMMQKNRELLNEMEKQ